MGTEWVYFYFGWNNDPKRAPFFTDKRVRQAMSYAFDHKEMLEKLNYRLYEACNGIYHRDAWMAPKNPPKPYTQNLDKAEDLLDEAGWGDSDGDGIRDKTIDGRNVKFEFSIMTSETEEAVNICKLLKSNLEQIGILCNVRPTEWTSMQEAARNHNFQAMFAGWGTGTDPDMSENLWATNKDRNYVQYANPKVDELFERGRKEFDRQKRAEIYAQIHLALYEDQPYTWLYFRNAFYGFNKDLRGYMFSPRGPYSYDPGIKSIYAVAE
jgi:peptide/nickel transport system substrate-binding protein